MNGIPAQKNIWLTLMVWCAVFFVPHTAAGFFASEGGTGGNAFVAGTMSLEATPVSMEMDMTRFSTTSEAFAVDLNGSVDGQYRISASRGTSCSAEFFSSLEATLTHGTTSATGMLDTIAATSTSNGSWDIDIRPADWAMLDGGEKCEIELSVEAWQEIFAVPTSGGFVLAETIAVTVIAGEKIMPAIVLNEVLADPDTTSTSSPNVEFIELYNNTDGPIDVAGWEISEMTASGTENRYVILPSGATPSEMQPYGGGGSTVIPTHGWLALEFGGGSHHLNNDGDTIRLYDTGGVLFDTYVYTTSIKGKSDARIPDGTGDWVDPIPTPGTPNIITAEVSEKEVSEPLLMMRQATTTQATTTRPTSTPLILNEDSRATTTSATSTPPLPEDDNDGPHATTTDGTPKPDGDLKTEEKPVSEPDPKSEQKPEQETDKEPPEKPKNELDKEPKNDSEKDPSDVDKPSEDPLKNSKTDTTEPSNNDGERGVASGDNADGSSERSSDTGGSNAAPVGGEANIE